MLKKILLLSPIFMLNACISYSGLIPPQPKYKISDEDMKEILLKVNNAEQCIHPELATLTYEEAQKKVYRKYSQAERLVWDRYVIPKTTIDVIGERDASILFNDPASLQYTSEKHNKLNNQIANVNPTECKAFKKEFNTKLKEAEKAIKDAQKKQIAQQKAIESQRKKQQAEAERKRKALEAYYKTPAGQMELTRQQMARQHQEMMEQQQRMMAAQAQAQRSRDMDNWMNSAIQQSLSMPNYNQNYQLQNINRSLNQINSTLDSMTPRQPGIGPRWNNVY